ncbi:Uncharacterised protein [Vibrio cholerae]|nr:Uncharacterised protein [Vibrio cholerae]
MVLLKLLLAPNSVRLSVKLSSVALTAATAIIVRST